MFSNIRIKTVIISKNRINKTTILDLLVKGIDNGHEIRLEIIKNYD